MYARKRWLPVLAVILLLGVLLKTPLLVALATALFVVLGVASWWQKHALDGVSYRRRFHFTRAFPEEQVALRIEIENRKLLPLSWLRVQDPWPRAVGPEDDDLLAPSHVPDRGFLTNVFSLRWFELARRAYTLRFRKRGIYTVGPARLDSGDLFGFYEQAKEAGQVERLVVFPPLLPVSEMELPAEDPFGDRRSRRRLFEDPNRPMGVRQYHPEDSFRRVHWPATARTGQLQVKVFQPTSGQVMVVCLNVSTFARHWEGVYPELMEHLVQVAATLVNQGVKEGYKVGLIANGCLAHADQPFCIPPGRSPQQLARLLEALAGVTSVVTAPFERFLLREAPRVPFGATLVILTAINTPGLPEVILQLKRHERRISLYSLAQDPPPAIPGVQVIHRPFRVEEELVHYAKGSK
jgi:uncharacterized protein (DUF58 family)